MDESQEVEVNWHRAHGEAPLPAPSLHCSGFLWLLGQECKK